MRFTSYLLTFAAVTLTLILNIISSRRVDWLVVRYTEVLGTKITYYYGLSQVCELTLSELPSPSGDGKLSYRNYTCRPFPDREHDKCDTEKYGSFCTYWTTAFYLDEIALGFAGVSLVGILIGATTRPRRRRVWRSVVGLVFLTVLCQIAAFAIVTDMYQEPTYPGFEYSRPALGYALHTLTWTLNVLIILGVITTGLAADAGHRWAAGNRAYQPIA